MKIFEKNDFLTITKIQSDPVISIYVKTSRKSTNAYKEDILELKKSNQRYQNQSGEFLGVG